MIGAKTLNIEVINTVYCENSFYLLYFLAYQANFRQFSKKKRNKIWKYMVNIFKLFCNIVFCDEHYQKCFRNYLLSLF